MRHRRLSRSRATTGHAAVVDGCAARAMAAALVHRGPDDEGVWTDAAAGIGLGFRRLAIVDLSPAGHQPMESTSGRLQIVFNGEIYNHRELRRRLLAEQPDAHFRGHSDTEVLLAAIEAWGLQTTLERAVGMFALAVWDRREQTLSLARDRVGEKPLYYGLQRQTLLFASELKALQTHPAFAGEIDREALSLFMRHGYIPAPHSIYQHVFKLLPGSLIQFSAPLLRKSLGELPKPVPYWSASRAGRIGRRQSLCRQLQRGRRAAGRAAPRVDRRSDGGRRAGRARSCRAASIRRRLWR